MKLADTVREVFLGEIRIIPHFSEACNQPPHSEPDCLLMLPFSRLTMVKTRRRSYGPPPAPPGAKKKRKTNRALVGIDSLQSIVKVMTENDWLDAKNLGILEQTCKSARTTICTDEVWEALCLRTWPNSKHLNVQFLSKAGGHRAWYILRRPTGANAQPCEPIPPPRRHARDILFWVDIKAGDSPIISSLHSGDRHLKLDVEGSVINGNGRVLFRNIPNVGGAKYVLGETNEILSATSYRSEAFTVEVQMSINEQTCNRICQVMQPDAMEFFSPSRLFPTPMRGAMIMFLLKSNIIRGSLV